MVCGGGGSGSVCLFGCVEVFCGGIVVGLGYCDCIVDFEFCCVGVVCDSLCFVWFVCSLVGWVGLCVGFCECFCLCVGVVGKWFCLCMGVGLLGCSYLCVSVGECFC